RDWSSDVCSSDLTIPCTVALRTVRRLGPCRRRVRGLWVAGPWRPGVQHIGALVVVLSCCSQPHGDNFFGLDLRPCGLNESHGGVVALGAGPDRVVGPGGPGVLGRVDAGEDNPLGEDFAVVAVVGCDVVADGVLEAGNAGSR